MYDFPLKYFLIRYARLYFHRAKVNPLWCFSSFTYPIKNHLQFIIFLYLKELRFSCLCCSIFLLSRSLNSLPFSLSPSLSFLLFFHIHFQFFNPLCLPKFDFFAVSLSFITLYKTANIQVLYFTLILSLELILYRSVMYFFLIFRFVIAYQRA